MWVQFGRIVVRIVVKWQPENDIGALDPEKLGYPQPDSNR